MAGFVCEIPALTAEQAVQLGAWLAKYCSHHYVTPGAGAGGTLKECRSFSTFDNLLGKTAKVMQLKLPHKRWIITGDEQMLAAATDSLTAASSSCGAKSPGRRKVLTTSPRSATKR